MRSCSLLFITAVVTACAAKPGGPAPFEAERKSEALEGAPCEGDAQCGAGEYCDLLACIPEAGPCPARGQCRTQTRFYDGEGALIPDADPAGVERVIVIDRPAASVAGLRVGVTIRHSWRGDLRVTLTSPSGTEHVLHDRSGGSADDLRLTEDLGEVFDGESAVGDWTLHVSDHARLDVGRLESWRLELAFAEPAPDPGPGDAVWASVGLPGVASVHPYAHHTDRTWDLRPFSGGATRARIRFSRLEVERGYDEVEVIDMASGRVLDRFSGTYGAFTTREYPTGDLGIRLASDYSITGWGFAVESVEVFGLGCLADADCGQGFQCPTEVVRCIRFPCFLTCQPVAPGGEGDGCASDADCGDGLYCATDGFCATHGSCDVLADCELPSNAWPHVLCVGHPTCGSAGICGWSCDGAEICAEGDTRDDGCNVCTCSGGRWACTERYCPPVVGEGETCGAGTICDAGLTCDRGRASAVACGSGGPGICEAGPEARLCPSVLAPVCACTGQTFGNECLRVGRADWSHDGACRFDVAIPDADADGIARSVDVLRPADASRARVEVRIEHSYRGDLVVWVDAPDGSRHVLTNRDGGSADDFTFDGVIDLGAGSALGTWTLHVVDRASYDVGVLRFFNVLP